MRFIGSLIKYFVYLVIILIAIGAALFWFDTGDWLLLPVVQRAGNFFLEPMTLEINNINGSVRDGYSIEGLKLSSGDEDLFTLDFASISPDWDLVLRGMNGLPFVSSINVHGVSTDLDKVNALVSHFSSTESKDKERDDDDYLDISEKEPTNFTINPFNVNVDDVNFGTPYANFKLNSLMLNEAGNFLFDSKIFSGDNVLPLKTNAQISFDPEKIVEIVSSDLFIGSKGTGNFAGTLEPINARLSLTALSFEELLRFSPVNLDEYKLSGRIDGKFFVASDDGRINASGIFSMPRAKAIDIPFSFRLPFSWDGGNLFALNNATLKTDAASLKLNLQSNIHNMKILANGNAENISLTEIGTLFAPQLGLRGEGGYVSFDIDTQVAEVNKMLANSHVDINANIPSIEVMKMKILDSLVANVNLMPKIAPKLFLSGKLFGGKLFARGEAQQDTEGNIKPRAVVSVINLDIPTLVKTFAAGVVKNPSGKISATTKISDTLDVTGKIASDKLGANGINITDLNANFTYSNDEGQVTLNDLALKLGKGLITASGDYDIKSSIFKAVANVNNFEPRVIPDLKDVMGNYNLTLNTSGKATDINSIKANALINARNVGYSGLTIGNVDLPLNYSRQLLTIPNANATLPGGSIKLKGNVNLQNTANPGLELALSTTGIKLAEVLNRFNLQNKDMPISGKFLGNVNIYGPAMTANVNANVKAQNVKVGSLVNMPSALLDVQGNMKRINLKKFEAKINSADIKVAGNFAPNMNNIMNSQLNFDTTIRHLQLRENIAMFLPDAEKWPLHGSLNANIKATGTPARPSVDFKTMTPINYDKYDFENIALKLRSPSQDRYVLNASTKIDKFRPEIDIDVRKTGDYWAYKVLSKPLDLETAIEAFAPALAGMINGNVNFTVQGNTKPNAPIQLSATSRKINAINKIDIENISLPVRYLPAKNKIELTDGTAIIANGIINSKVDVNLNDKKFDGNVKVSHLDFGQLAKKFLPMGELVGAVDAKMNINGAFGSMPLTFADGNFSTTPGYIHKIDIIDKVTPTKKISFEKINGSFFWNGRDLFLNPGTGARAPDDEPLYRYFYINGSMGIPGEGLKLMCNGRFDLKILDQLLGALKGVFQYMTGGLGKNILRDAAGRVLGIKRRDFQNVSFTLANSWDNVRLLDLAVTKPIEEFLPIDVLNKSEEEQRETAQFKLRFNFPVGQGNKSVEDDSTSDQFKMQLIDNLFNIGLQ